MRIAALLPVLAVLAAACGGDPTRITEPFEQTNTFGSLEQVIRVAPAPPEIDGKGKMFHLTSRLVNRGDAPVTVRVVTCWIDPKVNMRTRATFIAYAIPGCVGEPNELTLAPGESSNTLWFVGEIEWPGEYEIQVRHALDPEFWGRVTVVAK